MANKVVWTERAINEVIDIVAFVAKDSSHYAELVEDRIYEAADSLKRFPKRYRIVPELGRSDMHEILVYRYRIIYHFESETITIVSVIHSSRDLKALSRREGNGFSK